MLCQSFIKFACLPVAALAIFSNDASAQAGPNDVRCYILSNFFAQSATEEKAKQVAALATQYFLGRLGGSDSQIEAELRRQGAAINSNNASAGMQACAAAMAQKGSRLKAIGERVTRTQRK